MPSVDFYKKIIKQNKTPLIMGILNLTPDSFYDGGKYNKLKKSIAYVEKMIEEGVDIIDIGACSSRPGSEPISLKEEEERLFTIFLKIREKFSNIPISIDTYRHEIARKAIKYGANMVNDIFVKHDTKQKFQLIAKYKIPYILMHMKGSPKDMQENIKYKDFENDIYTFFKHYISELNNMGIFNIILDPGFGFGKTLDQNYQLINMIPKIKELGYPVLAGLSRKSMINNALNCSSSNSIFGTISAHAICLMHGADIIRVHDVKAARDTIKIIKLINKNKLN